MKYTWLVEKYLEGELSGEALRKFELEILRKPEVAEEVERVRSMHQFLQEQHLKYIDSIGLIEDYEDRENVIDEKTIRQDMDGFKVRRISTDHRDIRDFQTKLSESGISRTLAERQGKKVLVRKVAVWMAAASLATLLAISSLWLFGLDAPVEYLAVYDQFYTVQPVDINARSMEAMTDNAYKMALRSYEEKNYEVAYQLFNDIPEESPPNVHYYLYKGITAMELGDFQSAIRSFTKLQSDVVLKHEGMWYMGLSYLGMEDMESARSIFEEIVATGGFYKKQAKKLLKKI